MALGELKNGIGPDAYAIYQQVLAAVVERDHPVGSLYISEKSTSPAELYGGTWERIEGKFIMGASDTYPAGSTGGEASVALTKENNGPHDHTFVKFTTGAINTDPSGNTVQRGLGSNASQAVLNFPDNFQLSTSGEGKPHNNIPPYYSMYIWRRVA